CRSKNLCLEVWNTADELKCRTFKNRIGPNVQDDHLALQEVGIPAIDIIDFDYPHWHRLSDRPANCDATGPTEVGKVLSVWLQRQKCRSGPGRADGAKGVPRIRVEPPAMSRSCW